MTEIILQPGEFIVKLNMTGMEAISGTPGLNIQIVNPHTSGHDDAALFLIQAMVRRGIEELKSKNDG